MAGTIFYSNSIVAQLREDNRQIVTVYSRIIANTVNEESDANLGFVFDEIIKKVQFPIIYTDKLNNPLYSRNIDQNKNNDELLNHIKKESALFFHGYTYSGHPACCAAALKNIEIIKRDKILEHVQEIEPYFHNKLQKLYDLRYLQALCDVVKRPAVFVFPDKMTSLDLLDIHSVMLDMFYQTRTQTHVN